MPDASQATVNRLPLYFRVLSSFAEDGYRIISSKELGLQLNITPEQVRKDLTIFRKFGKNGVGYYVQELLNGLRDIMGLQYRWNIVIVGTGRLGIALLNYKNINTLGFTVQAAFDVDPAKIGKKIAGVYVHHIDELAKVAQSCPIHLGIITVPAPAAQSAANNLSAVGVRGIWNFAPERIDVPETVRLVNEDLSIGLSRLSYLISNEYCERDEERGENLL